jgi:hypothetical protein
MNWLPRWSRSSLSSLASGWHLEDPAKLSGLFTFSHLQEFRQVPEKDSDQD